MPNFNSREVAERFREQCVADGLWPMQGDSELEHRLAAILDAALESAKREERRHTGVMDSNGREILNGDTVKASVYAEEAPQILQVHYKDGGYLIDYKDSESDVCLLGWFPGVLEVVDSLAEKEGGR